MKLTLADLDGIKLISDPTYFMETDAVRMELENAYMQGSQGWGVRREVGVYLALARDLKIAMELAATADNAQRMLKGAQLEGGRLKKKIKSLEDAAVDAEQRVLNAHVMLAAAEEESHKHAVQRDETKELAEAYLARAVDAELLAETLQNKLATRPVDNG